MDISGATLDTVFLALAYAESQGIISGETMKKLQEAKHWEGDKR